jgi:Holliday junction resolvasome RuvABC endonuclease subunit
VIVLWCEDNGVEYRGVSPSEIKKHATGKGNAGKPIMIAFAKLKWPQMEITDDNTADALWILDFAQKLYRPIPARRK